MLGAAPPKPGQRIPATTKARTAKAVTTKAGTTKPRTAEARTAKGVHFELEARRANIAAGEKFMGPYLRTPIFIP